MTRIDFYVLSSDRYEAADTFACRLAEKAFRAGMRVLLAVESRERAEQLDQLLWSFREDSFLPHAAQGEDQQAAVEINCGEEPGLHHGLLINLCSDVPAWFSRFERLAEIVVQQPESLARSRSRFGHFRDRGYPLQSHRIGSN
ncbi:DNA polymerase III subunit chi [Microbulbifer yueqingensis]|uniref:DNA polymerase III, chi subunit n=1 Tax=Microbulbifer yueqingensis TaxID=658219 RepID=A0A1G8WY83_9GAMM|nr:DNA polymerase III subunit chi [Microbulbifer yueqingensis]SDJ82510.1 DNA polymerase III, chi subunit [Microbulbifer yueqingensis]